ncbi:MAG: HIT domain-containing protein [Candidatus Omnitrophica bacterium]|nr:HIT domain-containing protein [Candidatus Omnitrophota bacterium]MDD5691066.1 HIT domain-containing protein [Candidatus Omnitrophota bacterium]
MDKLWAPWRINYINGKKRGKGCIFCCAKKSTSKDYVIFKSKFTIVMLNIYPYNNGHLLISPLRHIRDISQLRQEEVLDLFRCLNKAKALLQKVLRPEGYNIGFNLTRTAGAGITGHLHLHIVPRWTGDTNFMPVISNTKIISQSLNELAGCLRNADK